MMRQHNRTNKYGAKKVRHDGMVFDSKMEFEYYKHLLTKYDKEDIVVHPPKLILFPGMAWGLDFLIKSEGRYIDVKGAETQAFKEKLKCWNTFGPSVLYVVSKVPIIGWDGKDYGPGEYEAVKKS
jgi:hypothetical protein